MTWPTDRPGYPMHAERDGWHWLHHPEDLRASPQLWNAEHAAWCSGAMHSPAGVVDLGFNYAGPCLTPTEIAAQVGAAGLAMREACAAYVRSPDGDRDLRAIAAHLRSLPLPTPALDAIKADARRDGMREAANLVRKKAIDLSNALCASSLVDEWQDMSAAILAAAEKEPKA